jgi:ubiquinone/menaquinone biosynthesis C-methylase UbiE
MSEPPTSPPAPAAPEPDGPQLTARSFTGWPAWADLPLDVVSYGPDCATEADLKLLGRLDGKRVLDLGCGGGPISVAMAKQGAKVIAIDGSAEQLGHARRLCEREEVSVELHQGDLAELAFVRADTIDAAIAVYSLGMVADLDRVFRQVHRVLRPDAPLVLSLPHPAWRATDGGEPPTVRRPYWDRTPLPWSDGGEQGADHPVTTAELFTALIRANFRVDTIAEPEPTPTSARSRWWKPGMASLPATLVVRARKVGT